MENLIGLISALILSNLLFAQNDVTKRDFSRVDAYAISVKNISDSHILSNKLVLNYRDTIDKVRSIYRWITENISYDVIGFRNPDLYSSLYPKNEWVNSDERQWATAKYVLKERKGVCYGYACLFKTLCDYANIEAIVINGYGKTDFNVIGEDFKSNHAWNAVRINNKWYLLDATWGAGSCDDSVKIFTKKFDDRYFLAAPEIFILDHYPDSSQWTLLKAPPKLEEFFNYPIFYQAFTSHNLHLSNPLNGIIEAKLGDKIHFEITADQDNPNFVIRDDINNNEDSTKENEDSTEEDMKNYYHPIRNNNNRIIACEYVVKSKNVHDLLLYYNYDAILEYRIKVD